MSDSPDSSTINKEQLYGQYLKTERWRDMLHKKLAHKSLDIPTDEEMNVSNVHNTNTKSGCGWKEMLVLLLGMVSAGGAAAYFLKPSTATQPTAVAPAQPLSDSEYEVRFYDKNGKLIDIPRHQ